MIGALPVTVVSNGLPVTIVGSAGINTVAAVGDGIIDDSAAFATAITALSTAGGGVIYLDPTKKYFLGSSITLPGGVFIVGTVNPGDIKPTWSFTSLSPQLILGTGVTINLAQGGMQGVAVVRQGISLNPATVQSTLANVAAYSGTGVSLAGSGVILRDCVIVGFAQGISCEGASRFHIRNITGDCTNGLLIDNMHDVSDIISVTWTGVTGPASGTQFPTLAITGAANNGSGLIRLAVSTTTLLTGNKVWVVGVTGTTEANNTFTINVIDSGHADLVGSTFTNADVSGGTLYLDTTYRSGTAFAVTNSENPRFVNCFGYGHQTTWHFGVAAGWCDCVNCGSDGNNAAKDPTTTSLLVDSTAYGMSWLGGIFSSHGQALSFSSTSTLQSSMTGVSFNTNGGNAVSFNIVSGTLELNGCSSRSAGFTIGNSITKVMVYGCDFSAATITYGGTTAKANSNISSNFNGTSIEMRALPTADPHVVGQWWANAGIITISAG